jgi:hypothetical protein
MPGLKCLPTARALLAVINRRMIAPSMRVAIRAANKTVHLVSSSTSIVAMLVPPARLQRKQREQSKQTQ